MQYQLSRQLLMHWGQNKTSSFIKNFQMYISERNLNQISLKSVPKGPTDEKSTQVQITAGDNPLDEPVTGMFSTVGLSACVDMPDIFYFKRYCLLTKK